MFDAIEESFNEIAIFVQVPIIATLFQSVAARWNNRHDALIAHQCYKGVGVIAFICQHILRTLPFEQSRSLIYIGNMAARQRPTNRIAQGIYKCVNLGAQSAARTANFLMPRFF